MGPGELVRSTRERLGLSQRRLALRAGTTQAAVSRIERGVVSPTFALRKRVLVALRRLAQEDPSLDVKRLTGFEQSRVRVGHVRVIFELDREGREILVHRVAPRGHAYR